MIWKILISFFVLSNSLFAVSFEGVEEHVASLQEWQQELSDNKSERSLLTDLQKSEFYGSSLAELYQQDSIQPYTLNLLPLYFKVVISVHTKIQTQGETLENSRLKALSLVSLKKINDLFFHPTKTRRLVMDQFKANPGLQSQWEDLWNRAFRSKRLDHLSVRLKEWGETGDPTLDRAWDKSLAKKLSQEKDGFQKLADRDLGLRKLNDSFSAFLGSIANGASSTFGAVAGNIAWREGYLKNNTTLLERLNNELKPFDLLMEKKAYKFTDLTIPGHWGHVGVYMGTKEQLQALGLWDHPSIEPFKEEIAKGKNIFQVRRWGLVFDSLTDFVNLDEMAVLRVKGFTLKGRDSLSQTLQFLGEQIGKEYDFSFDAMTGETITCTEIVAFSYGEIAWPMEELLGRLTISPNDLAKLAFYTNSPLQTIMYVTGSQKGLHVKSEEDFGKTLGFVKRQGIYQQHHLACKREHYRHRREGLRFRYSCEDTFHEKIYASTPR